MMAKNHSQCYEDYDDAGYYEQDEGPQISSLQEIYA